MKRVLFSLLLAFLSLFSAETNAQQCPMVFNPVCASDGNTYMNACYAEAAGATFYTQGTCFADCIDPALMNPNQTCSADYLPVVGCNGIMYRNECEAKKYGITEFIEQLDAVVPPVDLDACFDYQTIARALPANWNLNNGVLLDPCPDTQQPVCGCNGITYKNACQAEASGIAQYTYGACSNSCVVSERTSTVSPGNCPPVNDPVCGCNGMTYANACEAGAAGVTQYTQGSCMAGTWQNKAINISCGASVTNATSPADGNDITSYPGCNNYTFQAPEKVFIIQKTVVGDLQVGLESLTPGIDLDLFVLDGMGTQVNCLGQSINPPTQTKEAVVLQNAPIGTYYIVVDGQNPDDYGQFILEVACGYLDCSNATYLNCGSSVQGNNGTGSNNILAYYCAPQNLINIDNSGPEVMYAFTLPNPGNVTIQLSGLSANLELFLLKACDRNECLYSSQNQDTLPEVIGQYLSAGTYYVVVDGYHGAISNFDLQISCPSSCTLGGYIQANGSCQANSGSITVQIQGGTPGYLLLLDGPVQRSGSTQNNNFTFSNLPPGLYSVQVIDYNGCIKTHQVNLSSGSGSFSVQSQLSHPACGQQNGQIHLSFSGGQAPYKVYLNNNLVTTTNSSNYTISNLTAGNYTVKVEDAAGCTEILQLTLNGTGNFTFAANPQGGSCSTAAIALDIVGGSAPFKIYINGSLHTTTSNRWYTINNLVPGFYTIRIVDANGCEETQQVYVSGGSGNLHVTGFVNPAGCGSSNGSIDLDITGGNGPFQIFVNGSLLTTINTRWYSVANLQPGTYTIRVVDVNGCEDTIVKTVSGSGGISITGSTHPSSCGSQNGKIDLEINGGTAPFQIFLNGNLYTTTNSRWYTINSLSAGNYTIKVRDINGCESTITKSIYSTGNLYVTGTVTHSSCGQSTGQITVDIQGGSAPFKIYVNGSLLTTTNNRWYDIINLGPGTYTIKVEDINGCEDIITKTINSSGSISLTGTVTNANCGQNNGSIALDIQGGTGPFQIFRNGTLVTTTNNRSYIVTNLTGGTYTIKVIDANGCEAQITRTVNAIGGIAVGASVNHANCAQSNGYIMLDIQGGNAPFEIFVNGTFLTTTNDRWYIVDNLSPGTYTIRVVDANGCEGTITKTVQGTGGLSVTATTSSAGCSSSNGSISLDITGGMGPFEIFVNGNFLVSTNDRWYTVGNLSSVTYTIRIVDKNGCETTITKTVSGGSGSIHVSASVTSTGCGSANGLIRLDIAGGTPNFDIYVNGTFWINTNDRWYSITGLSSGTYTIRVVDANGCEDTIVKTVTSSGSGLAFTYIKTYSGCSMANGTVTLTITPGTAPYQIFVDGTLVATTSNLIYTIQGLSQGNHIVRVKDALGCSAQETIEIIQAGGLNVNASGMAASCSNPGSIMLDISGGAGPFDIYIDGVFHTTTNDRWYTIYNLNAGTYTIRVVDRNGCEGTVTETVPGGGQSLHVSSSSTPCGCGLGTGTITIDIDNGTAPYELYLNDTLIASIQDDHYVFGGLFPGTYEIKVIDANGCQKIIQETVGNGPGVDLQATVHGSGCTPGNGIVNLDIAGGVAPFEIYVDGNLVVTTPDRWYDLTNLAPGTYTIKVIDAHGCEDVEVVTVPGSSPITLTGTTTACSCTGNTGTITVSIAGGMGPFDVFLDGIYIATTPNRQYTIAGLAAGTYDVRVVDKNGCEGTLVKTVQAISNLSLITQSTACGCGQANGTITVDISGGPAPYDVYLDGQLIATTPNSQYIIGGLNPGTYDIRIEDDNGCSATARASVASHNNVQLAAMSTPANCGINDGTITVNIFGGSPNYDIFLDNQLVVNTQDTVYVIDSLASGTYLVRVVDENGCEASKYVTVDESNNLEVESTNTACGCVHANGSITLNILGGMAPYDIVMDNVLIGITFNQTFTVAGLAVGTYDFEITDKNGCTGFVTDTVTLGQTVYFSSHVTDASCGAAGSISIVIQDGVGPYMLFLDGNMVTTTSDTTYTFDNLAPGNYSVRVKDSLGCEFSKLLTVGGSFDLDIQVTAVNDTCGNGGSATIHIFDGTAPYDIMLDGQTIATTSDTTFEIFNLSMGTYSIRVEDAAGCFDMETITIDSFGVIPHAFFTYMIRPGGVVKFFADSVVGTILWDFGDGDTSTLMNPVHYYTIDSTYVVCLTATTICGTDTYCDTITIPNVYNSNLVFKMEDVEGRKGETVKVPIKVENFDRVIDLQYSISLSNPDAVEIVGVSGIQLQGLSANVINAQTISLDWTDPSGDGVSLPDEFPIAEIEILLYGDRGDCSQVLFGNMPVQVEVSQKWFADPTRVMPVFVDADAVCINMMVSIKGNVHREDHKGIPDASVLCNNSNVKMSQAGSGDFEFDDIMYGSNCMLVPSKDGEDRTALNVIDIVQMNKHVRQARPLNSPYKIIAGDLNRDGRVSYQDKVNLIDLVKGDAQSIVSGESWRFIPANWQFTDPSNPFNPAFPVMILNVNVQNDVDAMDFVGVKLGDVDNSYSFDGNQAIPTFRTLRFETEDQSFAAGDELTLEIRSSDFQNISGFQTEWNFDQSILEFEEIQAASIVGMGAHNLGTASLHDGIVTLVWHDEENLPFGVTKQSDEVLFRLVFKAKKDGNTLNGKVWQNNLVTGSLAVNAEGGALDVSWELKNLTAIDEVSEDRLMVKAYPNPFSAQTQINVQIIQAGDALLTVYDQTGRLVWQEQRAVIAGNEVFNLEGKLFKSGGIYFYRVQNGNRTESGKLIYIP